METHPNFSRDVTARINFIQTEQVEEETLSREPFSLSNQGDFFITVTCLLLVGISFFSWIYYIKSIREQLFTLMRSQKLPCRNCRYFNNNSELNCAVQPFKVLKEEAKNCPDYEPKDSREADYQSSAFSHPRNFSDNNKE